MDKQYVLVREEIWYGDRDWAGFTIYVAEKAKHEQCMTLLEKHEGKLFPFTTQRDNWEASCNSFAELKGALTVGDLKTDEAEAMLKHLGKYGIHINGGGFLDRITESDEFNELYEEEYPE